MDKALWISWYDLPEAGRDAYLSWLHETYMPGILRRPGVLWAAHYAAVPKGTARTIRRDDTHEDTGDPSLPAGTRYILLFGGEHAHVFGNPVPSALNAGLPEEGRRMLATRTGERVNILVEAARVENRALAAPPAMMPAPCIQLGNFNYPWQHEGELLAWFTQWRMPAITAQPGCTRVRRLASVAGWAKHAVLYEWTSVEARNREYLTHEDGNPEMKAWSDRVVGRTIHAPGSATLATRLWPPASN